VENYDRESDGALNNSIVEQLVEKTSERLTFQEVALNANDGKLTPEPRKSTKNDYVLS
jgi:trigger factor